MKHIIQQVINQMSEEQVQDLHKKLNSTSMRETMNRIYKVLNPNEDLSVPTIVFRWNESIKDHADMEPKTIYLDGSCRGFGIRYDIGSVSFDHHSNCIRSITYATSTQVLHALLQGMDVAQFEQVIVDDLDADTIMAVWLIQNPSRVHEKTVQTLVREIGYVDAHFTNGFRLNPLHRHINPYNVEKTEALFNECLDLVDLYLDEGACVLPELDEQHASNKGMCFGFVQNGEDVWASAVKVEDSDFETMYKNFDIVMRVSQMESKNGTSFNYTIGKKNEFVMMCDFESLFDELGKMELQTCEDLGYEAPTKNWGGGSTIGGSAMFKDQKQGSYLSIDLVIATIIEQIGENV